MSDFEGGPQKALLREKWDLPIIQGLSTQLKRPLRYFGMPGPSIEDVRAWSGALNHVTAIELLRLKTQDEDDDRERHRRLNASLLQNGIDYQILRGYVEDVLIKGHDIDNKTPPFRKSTEDVVRFCYDLVNLDFFGGAGYGRKTVRGRPKRLTALKELFRRQQGTEFILLLTLNVRDTIDEGLTEYLQQLRKRVDDRFRKIVDWYAKCGNGQKKYRLKVAILAFLQRVAEDECFKVYCYPPIGYSGSSNATMVHFALHCTPTGDQLHSWSIQTPEDLLRLPLLSCTNGTIDIAPTQHEDFDWQHCYQELANVPKPFMDSLQAQALAQKGGGLG